ncbi:uncharacterized protein (DUF2141 family) [Dysgonomonas sp. PH5-45]|uniref:DUF2141 domain-containing protein n=1 Tax=unclassified Dysgonomonas TaxID=2630389 RepID=UPI002476B9F1|nr:MULTISPECIES: DUF2141 domain-containing protein [unclassified Dysgonomonas]MDH6355933.1 uncharacterized protein (DUF2141 family) [Dysgonomonas sp. PH5-45]MDH6388828.1 uncharacterized protein (DUF2141 family) [Dysgonomonas sp. PH5-37]
MKAIVTNILAIGLMALSSLNAQNKLTVNVNGAEDDVKGRIFISVCNSPQSFMKMGVYNKIVEVKATKTTISFDDVPNGEYAVMLFKDDNDNNTIDLGEYGIPTEKYGFSNNIKPTGIPTFDACKFEVNENTTIDINLQ